MVGRYGADPLSYALLGTGFILTLLSSIFRISFLNILGTIVLALVLFRTLSKNVYARSRENLTFLQLAYAIKAPFIKMKQRSAQKKYYRFYKCPSCKQELRVPKDKGTLKIKCPKCANEFVRKT